MIYEEQWRDYELLDVSEGNRLERWGEHILIRPDPQVIWKNEYPHRLWTKAGGVYSRSSSGGGSWDKKSLPGSWVIGYEPLGLRFKVSPMNFKHTGLFPEQAVNWKWAHEQLTVDSGRSTVKNVLNLFGYTGGATVAAAKAGAKVCHVDASKGMIAHAKENMALNSLSYAPVRFIADDCVKFAERELRRGNHYDAVILDPPSFGRGAGGEVWKLEEHLFGLLELVVKLLSDTPLFILVNLYTAGIAPSCAGYMLNMLTAGRGGRVYADEIGLKVSATGAAFPCGSFARWESGG